MTLIGAHVGRSDPLAAARERGADCVQMFLSDPQSWKPPPPRDDADALKAADIPIYVHAPYLVNLASPNPKIRIPSRKILRECCEGAEAIGAAAVIVHGGHVTAGDDVEAGFERWVKALEQLECEVPVLLENTAGGDHALARRFDTLARLWERIGDLGVGFCLDTCHAHAAGEGVEALAERVLSITGRIDLVHCNDSKDAAGSGRDRHENIGPGTIGLEALAAVVKTAGAPVICETPGDGQADDIAALRQAIG